ncbi:hypothetical protein BCR33DRAFT_714999, partial [Rhizoclosmatium globosum]
VNHGPCISQPNLLHIQIAASVLWVAALIGLLGFIVFEGRQTSGYFSWTKAANPFNILLVILFSSSISLHGASAYRYSYITVIYLSDGNIWPSNSRWKGVFQEILPKSVVPLHVFMWTMPVIYILQFPQRLPSSIDKRFQIISKFGVGSSITAIVTFSIDLITFFAPLDDTISAIVFQLMLCGFDALVAILFGMKVALYFNKKNESSVRISGAREQVNTATVEESRGSKISGIRQPRKSSAVDA